MKIPYRTRALRADKVAWEQVRQDFLEAEDPTDYWFVQTCEYIENWDHWQFILASPYCRPDVDKWRAERDVKIRSDAIREMIGMTRAEKPSFQAMKYLADKGWSPQRGRPTKAEKAAAMKEETALSDEIDKLYQSATGASTH